MDHDDKEMKKERGERMYIPLKYKDVILDALGYYPELKECRIKFIRAMKGSVPYRTKPTFVSLFRSSSKRQYLVEILEEADGPTQHALIKNLPVDAQVGAIGHELAHVAQYNSKGRFGLMKTLLFAAFPSFRRKMERSADMDTIRHGLGKELYIHAGYIRRIPGYLEERREINKYYLKPWEILQQLKVDFSEARRTNRSYSKPQQAEPAAAKKELQKEEAEPVIDEAAKRSRARQPVHAERKPRPARDRINERKSDRTARNRRTTARKISK